MMMRGTEIAFSWKQGPARHQIIWVGQGSDKTSTENEESNGGTLMKFFVSSKFHLESECSAYMVCKTAVRGVASYTAWYRDMCLGQRSNATDAKRLCADHARRQESAQLLIA